MARAGKRARSEGRTLVLIDETALMMQPVRRQTWAPTGETPLIVSESRYKRWSVFGALTISPKQQRLGLYFQGFDHNLTGFDCELFVWAIHQQLRTPLLVVWDGLNAHKTAANGFADEQHRVVFHRLPAYAPQLNPVEWLWAHTKYGRLANFCPDSFDELGQRAEQTLLDTRGEQRLLRSFFAGAGLTLDY